MRKSFLLILVILLVVKSRNLELSLEYKNQTLHIIEVDNVSINRSAIYFSWLRGMVQETRN
jgi:hypothetical protein